MGSVSDKKDVDLMVLHSPRRFRTGRNGWRSDDAGHHMDGRMKPSVQDWT